MKKILLSLLLPAVMHPFGKAETLTVCDFENYEIGQKLSLWNRYGDNSTSTATVIADPSNPGNTSVS